MTRATRALVFLSLSACSLPDVPLPGVDPKQQVTRSLESTSFGTLGGSGRDDLWAMGDGTTIAHWDGATWTQTAQVAGIGHIEAVAATSKNRAWAIGIASTAGSVLLEWNGQQWARASLPPDVDLSALLAIDDANAWLGGDVRTGGATSPFVSRWDGTTWTTVDVGATAPITAAFASSASDVWLCENTVCHHYDGTAWTSVPAPLGHVPTSSLPSSRAPLFMRAWAAAPGVYYVVDEGAGLDRWDGKATELKQPVAYDKELRPPCFGTPSGDVFAPSGVQTGTSLGSIGHFDGNSYSRISFDVNVGTVKAIWASAPDDVWGVDVKGSIVRVTPK